MDIITSEIMRLDRVVKTFLDFTRPVQLNLTDIRLRDFMEEIAGFARPQASASGIEIVERIQVEDSMITVDMDLLKQAVFNIVVNAIEAMPQGGTLRFEAVLRGDDAEIRITDTGPGIPPEVKEKIYDLYFTTKQNGSGIGSGYDIPYRATARWYDRFRQRTGTGHNVRAAFSRIAHARIIYA